jgi:hypothetical protein
MGTSRNDRSPSTPSWRPALAVLGHLDVSVEQQILEIWRSAAQDRGGQLLHELAHPALANAFSIALQTITPERALHLFDEATLHASGAGLCVEMARRALARSVLQGGGPESFPAELFGEAALYYVSRDLPSFVAAEGRVQTVSEAIKLKNAIRQAVMDQVRQFAPPPPGERAWQAYVETVAKSLQRKEAGS